MKNLLIINEVDCYIGNAYSSKYATDEAVQHQILLNGESLTSFVNKPADNDRGQRVVFSSKVNNEFIELFTKAKNLGLKKQNESCKTIEGYEVARKNNEPINLEINSLIQKMYEIENLGINFNNYKYILA